MEVNEISIGDWARLRYRHYVTGEIIVHDFQIHEIRCHYSGCKHDAWSEESGNMGKVENLEPIPLTADMLELNELTKNVVDVNPEKTVFEISIEGPSGRVNVVCYFAHDAQRALRGCGLYERANKFKIK